MKMDYTNSSSERRAHELLAPLSGNCPDSVWETISVELEAQRLKAQNKWTNKINNLPRMPFLIAGGLALVTVTAVAFVNNTGNSHNNIVGNNAPVTQVVVKEVSSNNKAVAKPLVAQVSNNIVLKPEINGAQTENTAKKMAVTNKNLVVQNMKPASDKRNEGIVDIQASNNTSLTSGIHHGDSATDKIVEQPSAESSDIADEK